MNYQLRLFLVKLSIVPITKLHSSMALTHDNSKVHANLSRAHFSQPLSLKSLSFSSISPHRIIFAVSFNIEVTSNAKRSCEEKIVKSHKKYLRSEIMFRFVWEKEKKRRIRERGSHFLILRCSDLWEAYNFTFFLENSCEISERAREIYIECCCYSLSVIQRSRLHELLRLYALWYYFFFFLFFGLGMIFFFILFCFQRILL